MRLTCFCLLWLYLVVSETLAQTQDTLVQRLGSDFMKAPEAVGLSIGIYHLDKAHYYNFGTTEKGSRRQPTSTTIYEIGSITKTFVSTLLAYAVTEGRIKLDDDIRTYLPEPYSNLEYQGQAVKIVHLANLTSQLPNWLPDKPEIFQGVVPDSIPYILLKLHKDYTQNDFYRDLHLIQLKGTPGISPRHSNVAAQLLAFILERTYQKPLESLVRQYITQPLGMNHTVFGINQTGPTAKGYDVKGNRMPYIIMQDSQGSGGLTSTAADMTKYIQFQLDETSKTVRLSHQKTVETSQDIVGLNWHIDKTAIGDRQIWHTGGTFGFSSYIVLYPERKLGVVLLANESDVSTQNKLVGMARRIVENLKAATK